MFTLRVIFFLVFLSPAALIAQEHEIESHASDNLVAAEGTFQVIQHDKIKEVFTKDFLLEVESRRHDSEDVYWQYSEHSTIYIPSAATLQSPAFKRLELYTSDEK